MFDVTTCSNLDGTRFFGSPTKLFEYMACGKPIIASSLEQISDVLSPSIHIDEYSLKPDSSTVGVDEVAVTVTPGSVPCLVSAIKLMAENPHIRESLGRNARILSEDKYTWDSHVQQIYTQAKKMSII